jgi:hypothetical protein
MNKKNSSKLPLFISAIFLSFSVSLYALDNGDTGQQNVVIPMMTNAQVFADFTDDVPAVLNYFTRASKEEIIDFYQQHYGEDLSREEKRGRLTLTYQQKNYSIRVVISQQNKKRQVDVIVEMIEE